MKKLYTFLVLAFTVVFGNAQIVNIPDANFKAQLLAASVDNNIAMNAVTRIKIDVNNDGQIQVSEAQLVYRLEVHSAGITNLTGISAFTNLRYLDCMSNQITTLSLNSLTNLTELYCYHNSISSLSINSLTNLTRLNCGNNGITSLPTNNLTSLVFLDCSGNPLASLSVNNLINLTSLNCDACTLSSFSVSNLPNLLSLSCAGNGLTALSLNNLTNLNYLDCSVNLLNILDVSNLPSLSHLDCKNTPISLLFIKNGIDETFLDFSECPYLQYICADNTQLSNVQSKISTYGYTNCSLSTYCSFTPGGTFYTMQGNSRYDSDNDGCDIADINMSNLKLAFTTATITGNLISDVLGGYRNDVPAGTHTVTPVLENPSYFTISPTTASVTFPTTTSPFVQDFCATANGTHNDLEVAILPISSGRPGLNATYKILFKNKGTHPQSGSVSLAFDDAIIDFVMASPLADSQTTNNLSWIFNNLQPFETREIAVIFYINSPLDTPPVNNDDVLNYVASVTGITDENLSDNISSLNQTMVNSFDPNDKICVEGKTVSPSTVGQYVHYVVHFENTGTAEALNIVVRDIINTTKYDINSLVPLSGSAAYTTRIINTNQVEFIFQNINLPFNDGNNDGYVAFKIKTKPTLVVGNTFSNNANIYFDYNFPITTNTYTTTITALGTQDFEFGSVFSLSPVPTKNILTITTKQAVVMSSASIYNILGQLVQVSTNPNENIDVSGLKTGTYFIKIISDKGTASSKFIKE